MTPQMKHSLEGGCACGAVRYRLASAPMFVHCCHCRDCQRQTGSAFALNALIETDRVAVLSGAPEPVSVPTDSGQAHDIYRCPRWERVEGRTDSIQPGSRGYSPNELSVQSLMRVLRMVETVPSRPEMVPVMRSPS
jgi:Glutathione-dependent formaldehyde-activating enzyme